MSSPIMPVVSPRRRAELNQRSLRLAYATAGYNLLEGVAAIAAGAAASSAALLGFGLDSFVEVSSAIVLIGLLLNATLGWWWADPVAALVIAVVAVREGLQAWRGEQCDDCVLPADATTTANAAACGCGCGAGCATN
ncbi:hypothetical protein AB0F72_40110 [Actinoplanes sp. NPDC023936]|uniref:hypothetical protein n=1 Tax=Actinoplanes sp. NPDC023936 TaxID=3154910 RepID=UPI0033DE808E